MIAYIAQGLFNGWATLATAILTPLTSTYIGWVGLVIIGYILRRNKLFQLTCVITAVAVLPEALQEARVKLDRTKDYAQEQAVDKKKKIEKGAVKGVEALKASARHLGTQVEKKAAEINNLTKKGAKKLKKKIKHAVKKPSKTQKLKKKTYKTVLYILRKTAKHALVATSCYLLYRWLFYGSISLSGNRGHGGDLSFARLPASCMPRGNVEDEENAADEESNPNGSRAASSSGIRPPTHFKVVDSREGITKPEYLALLGIAKGLSQSEIPRFVMCVQCLENGILDGRAEERELELFLNENGKLLLPGEFAALGVEEGQSITRRLRAMDMQERIRQRQIAEQEQARLQWEEQREERERARQERIEQTEAARQANQAAREQHAEQVQQRANQASQRPPRAERERARQERRRQAEVQRQANQVARRQHEEHVRQRATEARQQQAEAAREQQAREALERAQAEAQRPANQPNGDQTILTHQVVAGQGGQGGTEHGGNEGNPHMQASDKGKGDHRPGSASTFLSHVADGAARATVKTAASKVSQDLAEQAAKSSAHYLKALDHVSSAQKVLSFSEELASELPKDLRNYLKQLHDLGSLHVVRPVNPEIANNVVLPTPVNVVKWVAEDTEKLITAQQGLAQALEAGVKENLKKQAAAALLKNTAKKACGGALVSAGMQYSFSAIGTTYRCCRGNNEEFNKASSKPKKLKALASEIYKDAPPVEKVGKTAVAGTVGSMIGSLGGPVGAFAGGIIGSMLGEYWANNS